MAYDPYKAVQALYNLKGDWAAADQAGDETKKNTAASDALKWYQELRANGCGAVADKLQGQDYNAAKATHDYYAKTGRTKTRPYFYDLGKAYGLSTEEVDNLIGWDDTTGEVTFGGKNIGRPDSVVDGTSYWSDTKVLDKAFSDYVDRTGLTRSKENAVNQENEYLFKKYRQEYDDLKNTSPFETETGKAILAKYDMAGLQGRNNELASGAGSNGGNIDSFAAANAMRQQASLVNQGQMAAIDAHQKQLDHARALLSDMGVNIDRVFNQDETTKANEFNREETAKNNKVSRDKVVSDSTGLITDDQLKATSSLWDDNGALLDTATDYQQKINELVEASKNPNLTASEKQDIALALKLLEMGRNDKITQTGSTAEKTYTHQKPFENANMRITKAQMESAEKMIGLEGSNALALTEAEGKNAIEQIEKTTEGNVQTINAQGKVTKDLYDVGIDPNGKQEEKDIPVVSVTENEKAALKNITDSQTYNDVDIYGKGLIEGFLKAYPNGASVETLVAYAVNNPQYMVDVRQLKKVCAFLGVDDAIVTKYVDEKVENAGEDFRSGIKLKEKK